jgi:multicomponent Na+:H+ antiporter subunit F
MFTGALVAIAVTMALALIRALLGPSVYDRVLAVNMFGTKTVLLLSVVAYIAGRSDYLDLALAYALINFIGVLAVLEFFRRRVEDPGEAIAEQAGGAMTGESGASSERAPAEPGQERAP